MQLLQVWGLLQVAGVRTEATNQEAAAVGALAQGGGAGTLVIAVAESAGCCWNQAEQSTTPHIVMLCCRAPEGRLFRPYDLLVTARESLGLYDEYFTVSANSVMTIRKGVQAEFVPLAEWVRQQSLFDSVSAIGFYKNYITGRAFRRWHSVSTHSALSIPAAAQ